MLVDEVWVHFSHRRAHTKFPPPKNNIKHPHAPNTNIILLMFLAKKNRISSLSGHKQQLLLCRVLGSAALVASGGMRPRHYNANGGRGGDRRRSTSWGIQRWCKRREKWAARSENRNLIFRHQVSLNKLAAEQFL